MKSFMEKLKKIKAKHILIFSLIPVFYIVCMLNICKDDRAFSENENRTLAQMPEISLSNILSGKYSEDFDAYANDQFISRDFFVLLKTYTEKLLLKHESNGVLFADEGYLIENPYTAEKEIEANNIKAIKDLDALDSYNITTCIVPTAFEILKDKLPMFSYNNSIHLLQKKLEGDLKDTNVKITDAAEVLTQRKNDYIYYRTDHHQTALGSYLVYKELGKNLQYEPYSEDSFEVTTLADDFYGTTWSKAMLSSIKPDTISAYRLSGTDTQCIVDFPVGKEKSLDSLYDTKKLETKDKYSVYLGGVHPIQVIHSQSDNSKKLAIIKDSYAHSVVPFLTNHFGEIHVIDMRYYNGNVVEYLNTNDLYDVLILYNSSTFMTDPSVAKLSKYSEKPIIKKVPYGLVKENKKVGESYFDDAVFIGDSLTDGIKLHSSLTKSKFLSGTGMTTVGLLSVQLSDGSYVIDRLKSTPFKKVYILLGINEYLSESNLSTFIQGYERIINVIKEINPEAYIYIQSILPVSEEKSMSHKYLNNHNIPIYNKAIRKMAEENDCYFLAVNEALMDKDGNLPADASTDGIHPKKEYYEKWIDYLKTHAISDGKATFDKEKEVISEETQMLMDIAGKIEEKISFDEDLTIVDTDSAKVIYPVDGYGIKDIALLSGSGAVADEIAVMKVNKENCKDAIEIAKKRIETRINDFKTYIPKEVPKLKKAIIRHNDSILIAVVTNDNKTAEKIIDKILK